MSRWVLSENDDGTFDVSCGGRGKQTGLSQGQAERYVREHGAQGDRVFRREEDGYLTVHRLPKARQGVKARRR